ncbi:TaqI-like C-terminal specificity domain-containing protein [Helicobacter jaachi]|uniref:TaqI-like C-terminal specificity domain-containing protein n=1 Tax=Helicobacter jaachi TaxID=1677920 RepID=UPI00068A74CE|nr:TaqI-like C-terminal specificity domain-containing protein [Helicobacter jaachi]
MTGYNPAFIIDTQTRDSILKKCSKKADSIINGKSEFERTKELIKPILRGRDIKRYSYKWAGVWLINTHNGYKIDSKTKIPPINIDEYPALKAHLDRFYPKISKRTDKGITPYNLRNCAYLQDFEKQKISWQRVTQEPRFILESDFYLLDSMAFIISYSQDELYYLLGFLNSKLIFYYFKHIGHLYSNKGFLLSNQYVEKFPVPKAKDIDQNIHDKIIALVKEILETKSRDSKTNTKHLESKLDSVIYKLYALTPDEIKLIES